MTKPIPNVHVVTIPFPRAVQVSLTELRARARRLRRAIAHEPRLQKIADLFHDGFACQDAFVELSRASDDPRFAAVLGPEGPLSRTFPGEVLHSTRRYVPELDLLHAVLISDQRMGSAFQFANDQQGVIALWTPEGGGHSDCFRYTLISGPPNHPRARPFTSRGGTA